MKVLIVEPGKRPIKADIDHTLHNLQQIVGGYIQAIYPFEEPIALICNEEGKLLNLPFNRALTMDGKIYDIVCGTFFLCSAPLHSDAFESLNEEQIRIYTRHFMAPEVILQTDRGFVILKTSKES